MLHQLAQHQHGNTVEPSITAIIEEWHFGPYREVAFRERSCFFLLFTCSSHISLHLVVTQNVHSLAVKGGDYIHECNSTEPTILSLNALYIILSFINNHDSGYLGMAVQFYV